MEQFTMIVEKTFFFLLNKVMYSDHLELVIVVSFFISFREIPGRLEKNFEGLIIYRSLLRGRLDLEKSGNTKIESIVAYFLQPRFS